MKKNANKAFSNRKRSALAAVALFIHATTMTNEALSLGYHTYTGYKNQMSEGTWVNDLTDCVLRGRKITMVRPHDDDPGVIRVLVNRICPAPKVSFT